MIATGQPAGMVKDGHADRISVFDFFTFYRHKGEFVGVAMSLANFKDWLCADINRLAYIILKLTWPALGLYGIENSQPLRGAFSAICDTNFSTHAKDGDPLSFFDKSGSSFCGREGSSSLRGGR